VEIIWKTAWKNVWRNKVRSLVVISSVTVGIFAGVFSVGFMNGMMAQRLDAALNDEISHIQITQKDFRINNDPKLIIEEPEKVMTAVSSAGGVAGKVERILITGMANTATRSVGVQIAGIDPEQEKSVFTLWQKIIPGTGDFFGRESRYNLALIGEDLARELNIIRYSIDSSAVEKLKNQKVPEDIIARLLPLQGKRFTSAKKFIKEMKSLFLPGEEKKYGSTILKAAWSFREGTRFTLTFLDRDNNQVGAAFRLTGIYDIANNMFESRMVFVRKSDLERLAGYDPGTFHQLIIKLDDVEQTDAITIKLASELPGYEVTNWKKLQPDLAMISDLIQQFYAVFMFIILAALAFGIVNTMLMAVLERTKELGMLAAIGMNRRKIFSLIMLESLFLSVLGGITGIITACLAILLTAKKGINFSQYAEGFEAMGYSAHVIPQISPGFFFLVTLMIIITGVLSSVYPALKALRLNPVEAIRSE
jgi:ABC-type lipoprotein release transport system permease subunit